MKENFKEIINDPEELERVYRDNRTSFESEFEKAFSEADSSDLLKFWKIRLDFDKTPARLKKINSTDIIVMIVVCLISGFLIKMPDIFNLKISSLLFYEKNAGIIVFFGLTAYTVWINKTFEPWRLTLILTTFIISAVYINLLPSGRGSDSTELAYIHLPLLMWFVFGLVYINFDLKDKNKRIEYIKHNGELAILAALILIAGGILTGITIGLFNTIGINIEKFYGDYIIITGLVCVPVIATFIIVNYATVTNRIAPILADIFSPLVLLTAIIYLIAIAVSGKDPYNNRDFLLIFNMMLLGVMMIIVFSVSETSFSGKRKFNEMILFILVIITVIIDLIALSAIFYRLGAYGISPNRLAVLGSNILILGNLFLIMVDLYKINFKGKLIEEVGLTISGYLPFYAIWILFVIFGFPLIFLS